MRAHDERRSAPEPFPAAIGAGAGAERARDTNATVDSAGRKPAATSGNLRSRKNAAADGTLVDAARGQALALRSSCHRVFRSRSRVSHGQASFAKVDHSIIKASPDLVAVTNGTKIVVSPFVATASDASTSMLSLPAGGRAN